MTAEDIEVPVRTVLQTPIGTPGSANHPDSVFFQMRAGLIRQATRTLGSVAEAEDLVQEVWLRWRRNRSQVESLPGWLRTVTRNLAVDRVRMRAAHGEVVLEDDSVLPVIPDDPLRQITSVEDIAGGMQVVLGSLSGLERVVFVLREALEWSYTDIARLTGRSEASVRQLQHRAGRHLVDAPDRFEVPACALAEVSKAFATLGSGGDVASFLDVLAPEVARVAPGMVDLGGRVVHEVAGIVVVGDEGRLLLCHRGAGLAWYPDVWDVAGCHLLPGEPPAACAVRAARQELRISVLEPTPLAQVEGDTFLLSLFVASNWEGVPSNVRREQHDAMQFFGRDEASRLNLADKRLLTLFDQVG